MVLEVTPGGAGGVLERCAFHPLPARPMGIEGIRADGADGLTVRRLLAEVIGRAAPDAVLRIRVHGVPRPPGLATLRAASVRVLAPATMTVEAAPAGFHAWPSA